MQTHTLQYEARQRCLTESRRSYEGILASRELCARCQPGGYACCIGSLKASQHSRQMAAMLHR